MFLALSLLIACSVRTVNACESGTEGYLSQNFYRCKCSQPISAITNAFVRGSCRMKSFWSCDGCRVRTIEEDAFRDATVYVLRLTDNEIATLNDWIRQLPRLEAIALRHNALTTLPNDTFAAQSALTRVDFAHNNITTIEANALRHATTLVALDLSYNAIDRLPRNLFRYSSALSDCDVSHNRLRTLDIGTFENARALKALDLSHNELTRIASHGFYKLRSLTVFQLSDNRLVDFDATTVLEYAPNLHEIDLDANRWHCEYLKRLLGRLTAKGVTVVRGEEYESLHMHGIGCESGTVGSDASDAEGRIAGQRDGFDAMVLSHVRSMHVELILLILIVSFLALLVSFAILRRSPTVRRDYLTEMNGTERDVDVSCRVKCDGDRNGV